MSPFERSRLPEWLLRLLQRIAGLTAQPGPSSSSISIHVNERGPVGFEVLYFPVLSRERAAEIIRAEHNSGSQRERRLLLATRSLPEATRELLRKEGISWAEELTSVCRLVGPGLLVEVKARDDSQRRHESSVRARLRDRSGLLAESILLTPRNERMKLGAIAERAQVSGALASRVLARLTNLKLLEVQGAGPNRYWRLTDPGGLLDLWATEEHQRPLQTTSFYVWNRSSQGPFQKLPILNQISERWALGGTAAANLYAPTLTAYPEPTIWVDACIPAEEIGRALGGDVVEKGSNLHVWQSSNNIALAQATRWKPPSASSPRISELRIVSRPRAYVEAMSGTRRSPEVAQNLRQRILSNDTD